MEEDNNETRKQPQVNLDYSVAGPVLYTDFVFGTTNEEGLVMDVCQRIGPTGQMRVVSRIGVSRNFAKKFLSEMGRLLAMTEGQVHVGENKKN